MPGRPLQLQPSGRSPPLIPGATAIAPILFPFKHKNSRRRRTLTDIPGDGFSPVASALAPPAALQSLHVVVPMAACMANMSRGSRCPMRRRNTGYKRLIVIHSCRRTATICGSGLSELHLPCCCSQPEHAHGTPLVKLQATSRSSTRFRITGNSTWS